MLSAVFGFVADILLDIFFDSVCGWTGEIILFVLTLSRRQPDLHDPSGWSSWLGLAFWIAVVGGVVLGIVRLGVIRF